MYTFTYFLLSPQIRLMYLVTLISKAFPKRLFLISLTLRIASLLDFGLKYWLITITDPHNPPVFAHILVSGSKMQTLLKAQNHTKNPKSSSWCPKALQGRGFGNYWNKLGKNENRKKAQQRMISECGCSATYEMCRKFDLQFPSECCCTAEGLINDLGVNACVTLSHSLTPSEYWLFPHCVYLNFSLSWYFQRSSFWFIEIVCFSESWSHCWIQEKSTVRRRSCCREPVIYRIYYLKKKEFCC